MRIAEAIIVLGALFGVPMFFGGRVALRALRGRRHRRALERQARAPWEAHEYVDGELMHFACVRPGGTEANVGYVHLNAVDFDDQVATLREAMDDKLRTLNARRIT